MNFVKLNKNVKKRLAKKSREASNWQGYCCRVLSGVGYSLEYRKEGSEFLKRFPSSCLDIR